MGYDCHRVSTRRWLWMGLTVFLSIGTWLDRAAAADLSSLMGAAGLVHLREHIEAPDFQIPTPDSTQIRLSDFRGRYVLLNFWATW